MVSKKREWILMTMNIQKHCQMIQKHCQMKNYQRTSNILESKSDTSEEEDGIID